MDHTMDQTDADIDRTRTNLGSQLRELEDQFDAATDWREHFHARPWVMLGAAGVVGFVLGATLRPHADGGASGRQTAYGPAVGQLSPLLDDIAEALVAVATTGAMGVIDRMVPGFKQHLARIEERAASR